MFIDTITAVKSMANLTFGHNRTFITFIGCVTRRTDKLEIFCHFNTPMFFRVDETSWLDTVFEVALCKLLPLFEKVKPVGHYERFAAAFDHSFNPVAKPICLPGLSRDSVHLE
jgi:hypothetical protein